ncbi:anti-sigma factor [Paralcaligenes sp. KSB-10]|uniref:anti-sigma factor n=1 Tax=Paralcaligenes sp. KSB-10 TaxID=2901142 RepID=UPI001E3A6B6F|nr:anti-sigma factor [Paralcaligenes sp. KSB-10]UHL63432.1 anti-sigma factor [Paralcaligenes sp. KSB-10]
MNERARNDNILAGEYVLGTLRGAARRRFEALMERDPALSAEVRQWQDILTALDAGDAPVDPPARVWRTIQSRLPPQQGLIRDFRHHVPGHRRWQLVSFALAASLVAALLWPRFLVPNGADTAPLPVAVLASTQEGSAGQVVASFDARTGQLVLTPLNFTALQAGHSLQLWLIAKDQKPAPLGLIGAQASTVIVLKQSRLSPDVTLAISLEPTGGSPTGQPTGAVLYAGKVGKI